MATGTAVPAYPQAGFTPTNITTSTTTQVKTGPGILGGLSINTGQAGASVTIFDNTSASGTKLGTFSAAAQGGPTFPLAGMSFKIGLCVVTAGATPADVTVSWA